MLSKLAVDSDKALAPFAAVRQKVADFLAQANRVSQATAAHRGALAQNLKDFPPFLKQLGPAMERLGRFAEQAIPVFANLNAAAPGVNEAFTHLPGFSNSSTKFFESLGKTSKQAGPALVATKPLLNELHSLGTSAQPFTTNLSSLFTSLRDTGGLERLMDFIFLGAGAANGYDSLGHFLRTEGVGTNCVKFALAVSSGCSRKQGTSEAPAAKASISASDSLVMKRTLDVINGASPAEAIAKYPGQAYATEGAATGALPTDSAATTQPVGGSTTGTTYYSPSSESSEADGMLLNYLLGN